jgi:hypothetical protein
MIAVDQNQARLGEVLSHGVSLQKEGGFIPNSPDEAPL